MPVDATLPLDPSFVEVGLFGSKSVDVQGASSRGGLARVNTITTHTTSPSPSVQTTVRQNQRSSAAPAPAPIPVFSKPRTQHRVTRSHDLNKDLPAQGDLLVDLLREYRVAKQREREGTAPAGTGTATLGLGVKSLLAHGPGRSKTPNPTTLRRVPAQIDGDESTPRKHRGRSASSASSRPRAQSQSKRSSSSTPSDSVSMLVQHLRRETDRANTAESNLKDLNERLRICRQEKWTVDAQLAVVKEELELYKVQLDLAQKGTPSVRFDRLLHPATLLFQKSLYFI